MVRSPLRPCRLAPLVALLGLLAVPVPTTAQAADPTAGSNPLDHPRVDAVALPRYTDGRPGLLVLDPPDDDAAEPVVRLSVLRRDPGPTWVVVAGAMIGVEADGSPLTRPWLVGLGPGRVALIVGTEAAGPTEVVGIDVRGSGAGEEVIERWRTSVDGPIDDAGTADADGDGDAELVLGSARTLRQGGVCQGSRVWVVDAGTGADRGFDVPDLRLAAGVLGSFDDAPGEELAAYAYPNCPAGPDFAPELRLVTIRLEDGARIADRPAAGDAVPERAPPPVRIPFPDGRDALLALVPRGLAVVDPHRGWADIRVATSAASPLAAVRYAGPSGPDGPLMRVAWLEPSIDGRGSIGTELVGRSALDDGALDSGPATVMWAPREPTARWGAIVAEASASAGVQAGPTAWLGDLGADGCPDLVVPFAVVACGQMTIQPGPAWVGTRPLSAFPDARLGHDRLVVASSISRRPGERLPAAPTPWAGGAPGRWRHGPSEPFVLAELPAAVIASEAARPRATMDRDAGVGPVARIGGPAGTRLLVGATALADGAIEPDPTQDLFAGLSRAAGPGASAILRVAVPVGVDPGSVGDIVELDLADARLREGALAARWVVVAVPLDDRGEFGEPIARAVVLDVIPPAVTVEAPVLTPIWPVPARLDGRTERGSTVGLEGGGPVPEPVPVGDDGSFSIETTLAPWPQTVRIVATDPFGNVARHELVVVGGYDYRTLPWPAIIAIVVLAGVTVSGLLGVRRRHGPPVPAGAMRRDGDDGPAPELEELAPGEGLRSER